VTAGDGSRQQDSQEDEAHSRRDIIKDWRGLLAMLGYSLSTNATREH
jgi:hypothetical protein